jgi:putative restriction endonuclease
VIRIFLGVTHKPWFDFLASRQPEEVNFWQPSGTSEFRALRPGDLFLFKLKGKANAIAGGGWFQHSSIAPISLVWEAFGEKNGVSSLAEMRSTVTCQKSKPGTVRLRPYGEGWDKAPSG